MKLPITKKKGFVLIDLLLGVAILAVVAVIIFISLDGVRERARDARRKSDLVQIKAALVAFYNANNNTFPPTTKANTAEEISLVGNKVYQKLVPTYLKKMPVSPIVSPVYSYHYVTNNPTDGGNGTIFALLANLETPDASMVYVVNYYGFSGSVAREKSESSYGGYKCGGGSGKNVCIKDVP